MTRPFAWFSVMLFLTPGASMAEAVTVRQPHAYTLAEIVARAQADDARVLAAEAQLRSLRALYEQATWAWFPKLETVVSVSGPTQQARTVTGTSAGSYQAITPASTLYSLDYSHPGLFVSATVSGTVPIFTFGKLTALREAAAKGVVIGEELRARTRAEVVYQCAESWYGYQLARTLEASLQESEQELNDTKVRVRQMLAVDSIQVTKLDGYKVEFFENLFDTQRASARKGQDLALAALQVLAGVPEGAPFAVVAEPLPEPAFEVQPVSRYVTTAESSRPEVRLAAAGVAAREKEVSIRERMFFPDIFLGGLATVTHSTNSQVVTNPFFYDRYNQLVAGIALGARITFDFPIKLSQLSHAEAQLDKTQAESELLKKAIGLEVKQTVGQLDEALVRATHFAQCERTARRWAMGAQTDFSAGLSDTRELVEALAARTVAEGEHMRALYDTQVAIAALRRSVGVDPRTVH